MLKPKLVLLLVCHITVVWGAPSPQIKITEEEYVALMSALGTVKPVTLQSAIPLGVFKNIMRGRFPYITYMARGGQSGGSFFIKPAKVVFKKSSVTGEDPGKFKKGGGRLPASDGFPAIYRNEVSNLNPISKRLLITGESVRKKRQSEDNKVSDSNDYDDEDYDDYDEQKDIRYAQELSFGLSTAGGVLGGAVGGYLDTTGQATLKLIQSLESLGLIALTQFDSFLDQQEKEKNNRQPQQQKPYSSS